MKMVFKCARTLGVMGSLALALFAGAAARAQEQPPKSGDLPSNAPRGDLPSPGPQSITIPAGTRLPLVLVTGVSTRTAKRGDAVYFETVYPIAQNDRIVIPAGTFVRGELVAVKRPGLVKGRAEMRIQLVEMTFSNGHVVALYATPDSLDNGRNDRVDHEGKIVGDSSIGRDLEMIAITTGAGGYFGLFSTALTGASPASGAGIGGGVGLVAGIAAVLLTRGPETRLQRGTTVDFSFNRPLTLDVSLLPAPAAAGGTSAAVIPAPPEPEKERRPRRRLPIPFLP